MKRKLQRETKRAKDTRWRSTKTNDNLQKNHLTSLQRTDHIIVNATLVSKVGQSK